MWFVYILKSSRINNWYYVGSTNRLEKRILEHNNSKVSSTKFYVPLEIVYLKEFISESEARLYEKKLKKCRKEKEVIVRSIKK